MIIPLKDSKLKEVYDKWVNKMNYIGINTNWLKTHDINIYKEAQKEVVKYLFENKSTHCRPDGFEYYVIDKDEIDALIKDD